MAAVDQKPGIFLAKKLALPTENTWEALQYIIWNQNAPYGVFPPFKVMTFFRSKMINIMPLHLGTCGGNY